MVSLLSFRLLPALLCAVFVSRHLCYGFQLPPLISSRLTPQHHKAIFQRKVSCFGFPAESIEVSSRNVSESTAPQASSTLSGTEPKHSYSWLDRVHQLQEYKEAHGDLLIPKRYRENPSLGNWVSKQRVQYRKFLANEKPCSMTEEKVEILNQVGFCWDGRVPKSRKRLQQDREDKWWKRLEEFRTMCASGEMEVSPTIHRWLKKQRIEFEETKSGGSASLDEKKLEALHSIDPDWWKSRRQRQWDKRYQELIAYKEEHGDCCVAINYPNKKLANWVSNCRKQHTLWENGEANHMSQERIDKLNAIGFVWDRWEFEFEQNRELYYWDSA